METSQNTSTERETDDPSATNSTHLEHSIGSNDTAHQQQQHQHLQPHPLDRGNGGEEQQLHQQYHSHPQHPHPHPHHHQHQEMLHQSMDHMNEESTGSGGLTSTEGGDSSTNPMDDSLGMAGDLSRDDVRGGAHDMEEDDHEIDDDLGGEEGDEEEEEAVAADEVEAQTTDTVETAATAEKPPKKEPATKRFKCLHCSKSYVREFQLNTHVRKYHPEKPVKAAENSSTAASAAPAATTTTSSPSWTQSDMEDALESLKSEKMSLVKASQHYGIPASTLWQRATRLGIMIPKNMARTSSKDGVADAVQLLKTGQISVNKASKVFGIPPSTLYKIAKREGIQLSSPFNSATTSWTQENLQLAMDAIRTGQMSVHMASVEFKIPPGTLYGRCKREGLELSRNNPVQWSPRDLKNALEAVKTGQMSINQASEHYKISYSSLYKRVKPHFVNNNNNLSNNQNLPKMGHEPAETDLQVVGGMVGGVGMGGHVGMDHVVSMHHPMDYETHRGLGHHPQQPPPRQPPIPPLVQHQPSPVNHNPMQMQLQYGNSIQQQQHPHHHTSHYGQQQLIQSPHQAATLHHYPHQQQQHLQQPLPVHRPPPTPHHPQLQQPGQQSLEENMQQAHPHLHLPQQPQQMMQHHVTNNGSGAQHPQDVERGGGYPCLDVDKHGLTSSSGIGLNGLMGISMGFLDFAPELPAPVAVPVSEQYASSPAPVGATTTTQQQQQSPLYAPSTGSPKENLSRHTPNNGHYNGDTAPTGLCGGQQQQQQPPQSQQPNANNNGYATLQNNYYHQSVIHSPVQQQQQPHNHHNYQHLQMHSSNQQQHLQQQMHHHHAQQQFHPQHTQQRHGMVPTNEDKLQMRKEVMGGGVVGLMDAATHVATAEYDDKVIVTTINDL